jgi:E3 ubiquitin-protein ligase RNF38/44
MAGTNNGPGGNGVSGMIRLGRFGRRFGDLGDYMVSQKSSNQKSCFLN